MAKPRVATVWLDGCSGCHMSIFDMDERLLELGEKIELVYSPLVDAKEYPEGVDIAVVEGAVGNQEQRHLAHIMRERTTTFVSLGDCAVTSNIVAYRNAYNVADIMREVFLEKVDYGAGLARDGGSGIPQDTGAHTGRDERPVVPYDNVPALLPIAVPIHQVIKVDVFIPGCPPSADLIYHTISELIEGRTPEIQTRFG